MYFVILSIKDKFLASVLYIRNQITNYVLIVKIWLKIDLQKSANLW
jgi:hypothetical protein